MVQETGGRGEVYGDGVGDTRKPFWDGVYAESSVVTNVLEVLSETSTT